MYVLYENQDIKVPAGYVYTAQQLMNKDFYKPLFVSQCCLDVNKAGYTMSYTQLDKLLAKYDNLDLSGKSDKEKLDAINQHIEDQMSQQQQEQASLEDRVEANAAAIEELATVIFSE